MFDGFIVKAVAYQNVAYRCRGKTNHGKYLQSVSHNQIEISKKTNNENLPSSSFIFWLSTGKGIFFCCINNLAWFCKTVKQRTEQDINKKKKLRIHTINENVWGFFLQVNLRAIPQVPQRQNQTPSGLKREATIKNKVKKTILEDVEPRDAKILAQ